MITEILTSVGLTKEEVELYESLLEHGAQTAGSLAKTTKVQRTYIYKVTQSLLKKGLISISETKGTTLYRPQSPDHLLSQAEDMKAKATQAQKSLEGILPSLKDKYQSIEIKPVVTHYEGEEGCIKANLAVLAEKKDILAYLLINPTIDTQLADFWKEYYDIRVRDNIKVRAITPDTKDGIAFKKRDTDELRETMLVPKERYPFSIEKNIVGNKVVYFATRHGMLTATIIENKEIADSERAFFELAWKQAEAIQE